MKTFFVVCMAAATSILSGAADTATNHFETEAVTASPSTIPTAFFMRTDVKNPTRRPSTSKPSVSFTPTRQPIAKKQTRAPIVLKSLAPAVVIKTNPGSPKPSSNPTSSPSNTPTAKPSFKPSVQPTSFPTGIEQPTSEPTLKPIPPTRRPTKTRAPTVSPSVVTESPSDLFLMYPHGPIRIEVPPNVFPSIINGD